MDWLTHLETVGSTNDVALEGLKMGELFHGDVVLSDRQTTGRGRRGKPWKTFSGELGIAMTLALTENLTEHTPLLVSLAVHDVLSSVGEGLGIKWPNDILYNGQKICGVLVEAGVLAGKPYQIVGCGMNLLGSEDGWQSIESLTGFKFDRMETVCRIRERILKLLSEGWDAHKGRYIKHCVTIGQPIIWRQPGHEDISCTALELTSDGALVMQDASGEKKIIQSGEIIKQGAAE